MGEQQIEYKGEFTIEERKAMTAQALRELRTVKKLSQKEVAAHLGIPATTYNTYESGRTEPPIEILVRLSHLYGMPIDMIVQRNRTYRTGDDVGRQMAEFKELLAQFDEEIAVQGPEGQAMMALRTTLEKMANAMTAYAQTEAAQKALQQSLQD